MYFKHANVYVSKKTKSFNYNKIFKKNIIIIQKGNVGIINKVCITKKI